MIIPNLFIVGSWKAGTTSLYHYLNDHPEVFMSPVKEPHYFVRHTKFRPRLFTRRASYLGLFKNAGDAKVVGEASAYYFCMPESAQMIHDFNPAAKIIIMLRNPLETIYAFHSECVFLGREKREFAEALAYQARHPQHTPSYLQLIRQWPQQIQHYQKIFGAEQVHIILLDDMIKEPERVYQETLRFLGVNSAFKTAFRVHNPSKVAPSRFFSALSANWFVITAMRIFCLSPTMALWIDRFRSAQTKTQLRPPMSEEVRHYLGEAFSSTIDQLSLMLGRDLSRWKTAP